MNTVATLYPLKWLPWQKNVVIDTDRGLIMTMEWGFRVCTLFYGGLSRRLEPRVNHLGTRLPYTMHPVCTLLALPQPPFQRAMHFEEKPSNLPTE